MIQAKKTAASSGTLDLGKGARAQAYALLLGGTMIGLPLPQYVYMGDDFTVSFDKDDRAAVDAWAAYLGLPEAEVRDSGYSIAYRSHDWGRTRMPFDVSVRCEVTVPVADKVESETPPAADQTGA